MCAAFDAPQDSVGADVHLEAGQQACRSASSQGMPTRGTTMPKRVVCWTRAVATPRSRSAKIVVVQPGLHIGVPFDPIMRCRRRVVLDHRLEVRVKRRAQTGPSARLSLRVVTAVGLGTTTSIRMAPIARYVSREMVSVVPLRPQGPETSREYSHQPSPVERFGGARKTIRSTRRHRRSQAERPLGGHILTAAWDAGAMIPDPQGRARRRQWQLYFRQGP